MSFSHWTRIIDNMNYLYYEHKSSQVCMVKEDERMYHACLSTHNYLNEMCLMNGSSLKGRQEAFIYQMHMTVYGSIMPISKMSCTIIPIVEFLLRMVPS